MNIDMLVQQRLDVIACEKAKPSGGNPRRIELLEMEISELRNRPPVVRKPAAPPAVAPTTVVPEAQQSP